MKKVSMARIRFRRLNSTDEWVNHGKAYKVTPYNTEVISNTIMKLELKRPQHEFQVYCWEQEVRPHLCDEMCDHRDEDAMLRYRTEK